MQYFDDYGDPFTKKHIDAARGYYTRDFFPLPEKDDFWKTGITDIHEIVDLFANRFYIGCEADDRSVAWAFNRKINPFGTAIRAMFGSDVGHWDVIDVGDVVVEAQELVDDDLITSQDFKEFMFWNPVELHAARESRLLQRHAGRGRSRHVLARRPRLTVTPVSPVVPGTRW